MNHRPGPEFYHVVVRPAPQQPVLLRTTDYRSLVNTLNVGIERHPIRLISYALLPTQWELVAGPVHSSDLFQLIGWVTATQTARLLQIGRLRGDGAIHPFTATAVAPAIDLVRICRFVERQAVQLRLTARAEDWPWSSIADRFRLRPKLPLVSTRFLTSRAWLDLVNRPLQPYAPPALRNLAHDPGRLTSGPQRGEQARRVRVRSHQNKTHPHIERPEHLGVRHLTGRL